MTARVCPVCGATFESHTGQRGQPRRYCSTACYQRYNTTVANSAHKTQRVERRRAWAAAEAQTVRRLAEAGGSALEDYIFSNYKRRASDGD